MPISFKTTWAKIIILSVALLPTTIVYFYGLVLVLNAGISIWSFLPAATFGYSLYSAWKLALKYDNYKETKIPKHVIYGVALGILSYFLIYYFLVFPYGKISYKPLWQSIIALYVFGGGPALISGILITRSICMNLRRNGQRT